MPKLKIFILGLTLIWGVAISRLEAQAPTTNALRRVFQIRVGNVMGTTFTIERNGKQYLVTARHIVNGLPNKNTEVEIFRNGYWEKLKVNIMLPTNPDVDIAALDIPKPVSVTYELVPESKGLIFGQEVFFLGFPHGLHTLVQGQQIPFIKRGTVSAQDRTDPTGTVWYIDGFNNPGFSGGPVVFLDKNDNRWKVLGVIQGYENERAQVRVGRGYVETPILVNSGILVAYDIQYALDAIDAATARK